MACFNKPQGGHKWVKARQRNANMYIYLGLQASGNIIDSKICVVSDLIYAIWCHADWTGSVINQKRLRVVWIQSLSLYTDQHGAGGYV